MRISVNLASRPFVELRPLFARLRLLAAALAVLAVALGFALHSLNKRAAIASAEMDALKAQTSSYQQQRTQNEARMRQPQNAGVLERSRFLNSLFARKSFSWTAVMMDLERVLPVGVQVTSIEPVISKEGDVSIRLRVTGDRLRAIQLVRNLERSQRFITPRLAGETALTADRAKTLGVQTLGVQTAGAANVPALNNVNVPAAAQLQGNGVEFEIFSGYNPLPEPHTKRKPLDEAEDGPDLVQPRVHHDRKPRTFPGQSAQGQHAPGLRFPPPPARPPIPNAGGPR